MDLQKAQSIYQQTLIKAMEGPRPHLRERNADFVRMYAAGATLQEIGQKYGITREAVRQILVKCSQGLDLSFKEATDALKAAREAEAHAYQESRVLAWSQQNPGLPLSQAEKDLGMDAAQVRRYLQDRVKYHPRPTSETQRGNRQRWSDEDLLQMIRQCKEETGRITANCFNQWSVARGGPTKQTPTNRFGTWAQAVEQAGVSGTYAVQRKRAYQETDFWAALVEYCQSSTDNFSVEGYENWQREKENRPSATLLRYRLKLGWPEMIAKALAISEGRYQGLDFRWVEEVLRPRNWDLLHQEAKSHHNLDELIPAAIADVGNYLTVAIYNDWAQRWGKPLGNNLMAQTGKSWAEIVIPYGARTSLIGRRGQATDEEVLAGLRRYVEEEKDWRYDSYKVWAKANHYPSPSAVAKRFGSYKAALARVQASEP